MARAGRSAAKDSPFVERHSSGRWLARRCAASVAATSRARARSPGAKEMAETRWWPPPPYRSASVARLASAFAKFHGFVPSETFVRTLDALTLTEYTHSGCNR